MWLRAPDPALSDGVISLRAWCKNDLGTVERAATDSYITETTTIPAPSARSRGLAGRAVGLLSRWAVSDGGLNRVEARVEPWNSASERILERAGFERENGLLRHALIGGRVADVAVYALGRQGIVAT